MNWTATDRRRRRLGIFFLLSAGGLFVWKQTLLESYLKGFVFLGYWSLCFLFNLLAALTAIRDIRAVLRYRDRLTGVRSSKENLPGLNRSNR